MRKSALFILIVIVGFCPSLLAADKYELKDYLKKKGEVYQVKMKERERSKVIMAGQVFQDIFSETIQEYKETLLEVKDGKVQRRRRTYQKCRVEISGQRRGQTLKKTIVLDLEGKTVEIRGRKKRLQATYKSGTAVTGQEMALLKKELATGQSGEENRKLFFPEQGVKVGQSWTVSLDKFLSVFPFPKKIIEEKKASIQAQLKEVVEREGEPWGIISLTGKLSLRDFPNFQEARGTMEVTVESELCLSGQIPHRSREVKIDMKASGKVQGPRGKAYPAQSDYLIERKVKIKKIKSRQK